MTSYAVSAKPVLPPGHRRHPLPAGNDQNSDAGRAAWQREMERAQLASWLSHGVVGHGPAAPSLSSQPIAASVSVLPAAPAMEASPVAYSATSFNATGDSNAAEQSFDKARVDSSESPARVAVTFDDAESMTPIAPPAGPRTPAAATSAPAAGPVHFNATDLKTVLRPFGEVQVTSARAGALVDLNASISPEHANWNISIAVVASTNDMPAGPAPGSIESNGSGTAPALEAQRQRRPEMLGMNAGHVGRRAAAPPAEAIRVHAQWSQQGVRLWLGIDRSAMDSLQPIAEQLQRWIAQQGLRLRSISCNGRVIARDAADALEREPAPLDAGAGPAHIPQKELP